MPPLELRGVRRYRNLEEADADRAAAVHRRVQALRRRQGG
jgi:hypothetical protein